MNLNWKQTIALFAMLVGGVLIGAVLPIATGLAQTSLGWTLGYAVLVSILCSTLSMHILDKWRTK